MRPLVVVLLAGTAAAPHGGDDAPSLPAPQVELRIETTDMEAPWKLLVTNRGAVPLRLAADGRLLSFDIAAQESTEPRPGKHKAKPHNVVCRLPPELRPDGVVDDRAVLLPPGSRYEEVFSPALYCFGDTEAKAFVPGAEVTAHFGFPAPPRKNKSKPDRGPFVVEPAQAIPTVAALSEIVSAPFTVPGSPSTTVAARTPPNDPSDPRAARIELFAPARTDTPNEKTVGITLTVKNTGGRPATLHLRRDNMIIEVDGPDGSAHCGSPTAGRATPKDAFTPIGAGASIPLDIWVGEICPDYVFDRPGLYRLRASLVFPTARPGDNVNVWTRPVVAKDPILVRVREGRLPFHTARPEVLGGRIER